MDSTTYDARPREREEIKIAIASGAVVAVTLLGDFLCWGAAPGAGLGVFAACLGMLLVASAARSKVGRFALALLAASCAQMAVDLCFTGLVVAGALLLMLFGESAYGSLPLGWARWSEAVFGLLRGPGRWLGFGVALSRSRALAAGTNRMTGDQIAMLGRIVMPAASLAVVFGIVLGFGNAILAEWFSRATARMWRWVLHLDFSLGRVALWAALATFGVALFWPAPSATEPRWWSRPIRRWLRVDRSVAFWQSLLVLVALNAIFFAANTIDAVYLWHHAAFPSGMTASRFVHEGVHSLIGAVLLAALVLTIIFQQDAEVVGARWLKALALAWIVQNVALIGSVLLRLKLYVEAYQLSELRVFVGCFLLLVATGFALLAWQVVRGMKLGQLLRSNALATFALFFVLQFADVASAVANYNVAQWLRDPRRTLDVEYLESLGAGGWRALVVVKQNARDSDSRQAAVDLREIATRERFRIERQDWRETQTRRDRGAARLIAESAKW